MTARIPAQRAPEAGRCPDDCPAITDPDPDATVRTDLHRSPSGQLIKVEVFGDGSTRVTAAYPDGRWHAQPFTPERAL